MQTAVSLPRSAGLPVGLVQVRRCTYNIRDSFSKSCVQIKTESAKSILAASIHTRILLSRVKSFKYEQFSSQAMNHKDNKEHISVIDKGCTPDLI